MGVGFHASRNDDHAGGVDGLGGLKTFGSGECDGGYNAVGDVYIHHTCAGRRDNGSSGDSDVQHG
jgi:hypothetical protein